MKYNTPIQICLSLIIYACHCRINECTKPTLHITPQTSFYMVIYDDLKPCSIFESINSKWLNNKWQLTYYCFKIFDSRFLKNFVIQNYCVYGNSILKYMVHWLLYYWVKLPYYKALNFMRNFWPHPQYHLQITNIPKIY